MTVPEWTMTFLPITVLSMRVTLGFMMVSSPMVTPSPTKTPGIRDTLSPMTTLSPMVTPECIVISVPEIKSFPICATGDIKDLTIFCG